MKTTVKLEGFKELDVALAQIEKKATQKAVMRRALRNAALPVAAKANSMAPTGPTGRLSGSVIVGTKISGEVGKVAYAKSMKATRGDKSASVKAMRDARRAAKGSAPVVEMFIGPVVQAFYARFVEFGTAPRINGGRFAGTQHPGTAPQPFMRPAWDSEQQATLNRIGDEMWSEIRKAAVRAAKRR